jgi:hypothetical protein
MAVSSDANADDPIIVDCAVDDVQDVLDSNVLSLPMELKLIGTCDGFEITKDDVSIGPLDNSLCPGATVEGWLSIEGAHRIKLSCLEVAGPDGGVGMLGSHAVLEDMHISGYGDVGIEMNAHAFIEMIGGSVKNHGDGVTLESSHAILDDVEISNNASGIRAENNSYVEFGGIVMNNDEYGISIASSSVFNTEESTFSNNGRTGIFIGGSSRADIIDSVITGHTRSGLAIADNSSVRWNGGRIAGNGWNGIFVTSHSTLRVLPGELQEGQATEIVDNGRAGIHLARDAGAQLSGAYIPPNGNGSAIRCDGKEASVDYSSSPLIVKKYVDCSDPDF